MNELADFLLARIAEDYSLAYTAHQDAQTLGPLTDGLAGRPDGDHRICAHVPLVA